MLIVHANWSDGALWLWGESAVASGAVASGDAHPGSCEAGVLSGVLGALGLGAGGAGELTLRLPTRGGRPETSPRLAHAVGLAGHVNGSGGALELGEWRVACVRVEAGEARRVLERLEECDLTEVGEGLPAVGSSDSVAYFATAARMTRALLAEQRFVPSVAVGGGEELEGGWQPWLADDPAGEQLVELVRSMPGSARAVVDGMRHDPLSITESFMRAVGDAFCRSTLIDERMGEAIEDWEGEVDEHVAWLGGLLAEGRGLGLAEQESAAVRSRVLRWLGGLEDRGVAGGWRLLLRLEEPELGDEDLADLQAPGGDVVWRVSFHLQSIESERTVIDAEDVWALHTDFATFDGRRIEHPQETLLAELGRAARLFPALEGALEDAAPVEVMLETPRAYEFLREIRPLLLEQGFGVEAPEWWDSPSARLGARLQVRTGEDLDELAGEGAGGPGAVTPARLGLETLVSYEWKIAVGDTPLTLDEFQRLASQRAPLVRLNGRWVEVRPEDVAAASSFLEEHPGGEVSVADALRMAYGWEMQRGGMHVQGLDASGWIAALFGEDESATLPEVPTPEGFGGSLRPYQQRGLSWMVFLDRVGLGPCLADDMGLGKTIQLLALLSHERRQAGGSPGPTLLIVPMSIVGNWKREAERFTPELKLLVHHGPERLSGSSFFDEAATCDLVVTTYALAHRDREDLERVGWHRVVLDEAQNIKNPSAKQSQAVRSLDAPRRVALTGTPLENRLSELWAIMEFCNPGLLGTLHEFKRGFSIPIERQHSRERAQRLRQLVRPFVLRRLKTDPAVITDLPEKVETKEYCRLTSEQARLYEQAVKQMLGEVESADGIRRRGAVLAALTKLKQACDHPALVTGEAESPDDPRAWDPGRSGKCIRMLELVDELVAGGGRALVFTQFRRMGTLLTHMLRRALDREVLFLHGGTASGQREKMISRFQSDDPDAPVFVLSLRAGGVGLNLTSASHVFHFDRWWNPAVENQATDRAYRIGQTQRVQVHKFVVGGTLEERIDQMIESKIALAEDVIGSGEDWLTEMSVAELREVLKLRPDALADDDEEAA